MVSGIKWSSCMFKFCSHWVSVSCHLQHLRSDTMLWSSCYSVWWS